MPPRSLTPEDARAMRARATPRKLTAAAARAMSAAREHNGAGSGRPRLDAPRCPCAAMTLSRAEARGKSSEHDPSCAFYRERAIIV